MKRTMILVVASLLIIGVVWPASAAMKLSFPFTPISAASLPWWIAKEARFYDCGHGMNMAALLDRVGWLLEVIEAGGALHSARPGL